MADERDIALAVLRIAAGAPGGICTFRRAKKVIPDHVQLDWVNMSNSDTRPGEPMWHQLLRNIKSHDQTPGNFIYEGYLESVPRVGYRITDEGRSRLKQG